MVTINTAFCRLFINGVSHQRKVSTKASTSAGLLVCGTVSSKDGGQTNPIQQKPDELRKKIFSPSFYSVCA